MPRYEQNHRAAKFVYPLWWKTLCIMVALVLLFKGTQVALTTVILLTMVGLVIRDHWPQSGHKQDRTLDLESQAQKY